MKKLLAILSSVLLISSASTAAVSCSFGIPSDKNIPKPDKPGISIPDPSRPTHPSTSLPDLPSGDIGVEVVPDGQRFDDFVDPTEGIEPSKVTIAALELYRDNIIDFMNEPAYQASLSQVKNQIESMSNWKPPFESTSRDSNNEGMMRYFFLIY